MLAIKKKQYCIRELTTSVCMYCGDKSVVDVCGMIMCKKHNEQRIQFEKNAIKRGLKYEKLVYKSTGRIDLETELNKINQLLGSSVLNHNQCSDDSSMYID